MTGGGALSVFAFFARGKIRRIADENVGKVGTVGFMKVTDVGVVRFNVGNVVQGDVFVCEGYGLRLDIHRQNRFWIMFVVDDKRNNTTAATCVNYRVGAGTLNKTGKMYCVGGKVVAAFGLFYFYATVG